MFGITVLPFMFGIILLFLPSFNLRILALFSLISAFFLFFISLMFYADHYFFINEFEHFFFDNLSWLFVILTNLLVLLCIIYNISNYLSGLKYLLFSFFFLQSCLLNVFLTANLLMFFIFFESVLLPMFIIIGIWGSRQRKIHALYYLFFYTLVGSIFMLVGILYIFFMHFTFSLLLLTCSYFNFFEECILFCLFFIGFAVKVPLWPLHIWLPEAHVESPTSGSVILAGILLKLGTYGIFRYLIPLFPNAAFFLMPIVSLFCLLGIIYCSFIILRQIDLKKIIAYSSVIHMSYCILGLFCFNLTGMLGAILTMFSHGFISSALFFLIGSIYERYHTRIIYFYGGLISVMPIFSFFFFFFSLANISFPGLFSFIGEILILFGMFFFNPFVFSFLIFFTFFSVIYTIWLYNKVCFGSLSLFLFTFFDCSFKECYIYSVLFLLVLYFGLCCDSLIVVLTTLL